VNLVIDQGNTFNKIGVFDKGKLIYSNSSKILDKSIFGEFSTSKNIDRIIISSVQDSNPNVKLIAKQLDLEFVKNFIVLNSETKIPITNEYKTPHTLGKDRIAALVGASELFAGNPKLVIDSGTAITIDYLDENNCFKGGNISPGIETRFKSLNQNTKQLPKLNLNADSDFMGLTTADAICSGVQNGVLFEIEHYINHFNALNSKTKTVLTGGDADFFAKNLKNAIFVDFNLVLKGLNQILEFNT